MIKSTETTTLLKRAARPCTRKLFIHVSVERAVQRAYISLARFTLIGLNIWGGIPGLNVSCATSSTVARTECSACSYVRLSDRMQSRGPRAWRARARRVWANQGWSNSITTEGEVPINRCWVHKINRQCRQILR